MRLRADKITFYTDLDFVESSSGKEYCVVRIEMDMNGQVTAILDTSPIEDRITITKTYSGNAIVEDYHGNVSDLTDEDLILFLDEIYRTVPPIKSIRDVLGVR